MELTRDEIIRYSRHLAITQFGPKGQLALKKAKVLVVGAGGLGAPLLQYLTAAGVGTIGIVDFDHVEVSNLQRQVLYNTEDVGQSKSSIAISRLSKQNPNITFIEHKIYLNADNALDIVKDYDLVADGTDNFATRYLVNDACVILDKPLVYGSIHQYEGQVSVFNYKDGPNYRDLFPSPPDPESVPNCAEGGVIGVLPGIIGSAMANETIKIISQTGTSLSGRLFIFDALDFNTQTIRLPKANIKNKVKGLIDYEQFCNPQKTNTTMVKEISVEELNELRKNNEEHVLIDVREPHECDVATLDGELIPLGTVAQNMDKFKSDKKVIVHCRSGARSANAIKFVQEQRGYENLFNLKGGILAWANEIDEDMATY